jgi:prevent-host-death family protein
MPKDTPVMYTLLEARFRLSELIKRSAGGERVLISMNGKPVVQILPIDAPPAPVRRGQRRTHLVGTMADERPPADR